VLRNDAPPLRTVEAILKKNEQILDGLERGTLTPKMGEQMGQCIKTPQNLVRLEISYHRMIKDYGRTVPVPRSPLLRSMIPGLNPDKVEPTDGEKVRALIGEK